MTRLPRGAFSWALYDLANTVYSMNVVSLFFAQWVTVDRGREDLWVSVAYSGSMLAVALTVPYLGLWSDRGGLRLRFLAACTVLAVVATALLGGVTRIPGTEGLVLGLAVFALSNFGFQAALVFYNALLPAVSTPATLGRVSGLGVALGYVGSFLGMMLVVPFVTGVMPLLSWDVPFLAGAGRTAAFLPTAVLFAAFSVPLFLRVREPAVAPGPRPRVADAFAELKRTLLDSRRYPGVLRFLVGNFLVLDAVHTFLLYMAVYAEKVVGLPDTAKAVFFMLATLPAIAGSFVAGWLSDRIGPRPVFLVTAWLWVVAAVMVAAIPTATVLYAAGGLVGLLLGSLWTTTRPFLLALTPDGEEGRLFGLYALGNKAAAVVGPLLWGAIVLLAGDLGTDRYRLAVLLLGGLVAAGAFVLGGVRPAGTPGETGGPARTRT